jgi:hypothetical protein
MMPSLLTPLRFNVPIEELRNYYSTLEQDYQHLNWSWAKCGGEVVKQWRDAAHQDAANLLTTGWAIQSNLVDLSIPCPPWNISTHPTTDYRNTALAFGIINRLQAAIPFGYRWAVSVQPPGGKVGLHSDQEDEYTVWIPVYTNNSPCITFVSNNIEQELNLVSNGTAYLLDTTVPHYTYNAGDTTRVTIIFRLNQQHKDQLLSITQI